jgi:hypothetical protein
MHKYDIRRAALRALADKLGWGGITEIARKISKDPNYVSRMLSSPEKKGAKNIGEDSVDALNDAFPGWLESIEIEHVDNNKSSFNSDSFFTPAEKKLVEHYRSAGKATQAAVELFLLPSDERFERCKKDRELLGSINFIEQVATGVLSDSKNRAASPKAGVVGWQAR